MKRARQKKTGANNKYDSIDVPEMINRNKDYKKTTSGSKVSTKKTARNKKKLSKTKKRKRAVLIVLLVLLSVFLILMGIGWGPGTDGGALVPVDMDLGKLNVLLLGVDKEGLRTDAMMLVSYDLNERQANLLSIPRDTRINVEDRDAIRKINEIHAMHDENNEMIGVEGSIAAVTALTSIPVHYYIEFNFDAIDDLSNAIGPIEFDVPDVEGRGRGMNYDDPYQDLHIHLKPGLQELVGNEVQQFLRYRKSNSDTSDGSDTSRVERQQAFLKAAIDQKVNFGLIEKIPGIYKALAKNIKTNFTLSDMVKYAKYLDGLTSEKMHTYSLPGESKRLSAGWYFVCDFEETAELVKSFGYEPGELTNVINIGDLSGGGKPIKSYDGKEADKQTPTPKPKNTPKPSPEEEEEEPTPKPEKKVEKSQTPAPDDDEVIEIPKEEEENSPTPTPTKTSTPKPTPEQTPDTSDEEEVITIE